MPEHDGTTEREILLLRRGRGEGLAIAALAVGIVSYINLLGAEKALLTITLAALARRAARSRAVSTRSSIAIGLALVQLTAVAAVLVLFHDKLGRLLTLLHDLS